MLKYCRNLLIVLSVVLASKMVLAQGLSLGLGISDALNLAGTGSGPAACSVLQANMSVACNSALMVVGF